MVCQTEDDLIVQVSNTSRSHAVLSAWADCQNFFISANFTQGRSRRGFRGARAPTEFYKALIGTQVNPLESQESKFCEPTD